MMNKDIQSAKYKNFWRAMKGIVPEVASKVHLEVKNLEDLSYEQGFERGQEDLKKATRDRAEDFMKNGHGDLWQMLLELIGDINTKEECEKEVEGLAKKLGLPN